MKTTKMDAIVRTRVPKEVVTNLAEIARARHKLLPEVTREALVEYLARNKTNGKPADEQS